MSGLDTLAHLLARLPGLGPRSGRRLALFLAKRREAVLLPLLAALSEVAETVRPCPICGNLDSVSPCGLCADHRRDGSILCVVESAGDVWAIERTRTYRGGYHVLGGLLSAFDGVGPEELGFDRLVERVGAGGVGEVVLALAATVEGQTTAHALADRLRGLGVAVTGLAHGVPVGGELDYLDDGTLEQAFKARRPL